MKRILVAVDLSDVTGEVMAKTATLAKALQGRVCLLHTDILQAYFSQSTIDLEGSMQLQVPIESLEAQKALSEICYHLGQKQPQLSQEIKIINEQLMPK